ncbi:MAG: hypothetical protein P8M78_05055 [Myxococcota bacterium]|nr:hypothetical protein [Myxococcota bacterium]
MRNPARANLPIDRCPRYFILWFAALFFGLPASGLIIDAGDGSGNTMPPDPDWGWANVGTRSGGTCSVVYLGNRWVITAAHVGAGITEFDGVQYQPVAHSPMHLKNPDGSKADLVLFRLSTDPPLPKLTLGARSPRPGQAVTLVGLGSARGGAITIDSEAGLIDGFMWATPGTRRWGSNQVAGPVGPVQHGDAYTLAFPMIFEAIGTPGSTDQEAAAAHGDSGGAVFALADALQPEKGYALVGIIFSVSNRPGAPPRSSLYGSATFAADIALYRDQILDITHLDCPENTLSSAYEEGRCEPQHATTPAELDGLQFALIMSPLALLTGLILIIRRRYATRQ